MAEEDVALFKPADTSSPRATLQSFIESCNEFHARIKADHYFDRHSREHYALGMRVLDCLDSSQLPEFDKLVVASEAAICIKEVLDRFELPTYEELPDLEAIGSSGAEYEYYRIPGTRITISRIEEGPQRHEYLFSAGTVDRARRLFEDTQSLPYRTTGPATSPGFFEWYNSAPANETMARIVDRFPEWLLGEVYGQALWKWFGVLLAVLVGAVLMVVIYRAHGALVDRWRKHPVLYAITILLPLLAAGVPILMMRFIYYYVGLRGQPLYVLGFTANLIAFLALVVVVFGASNRIASLIIASPRINPKGLDAQFVRIMSRLLGVSAAVIVMLQGGQYIGIPVATLIASAGIGGLAVALAAQDTLRNLFGTIMLLTDKPFRVGERIVFGSYDGVVEEIGLRSTRIRLLTGHQATIPNDELARNDIENIGRRPHIRRIMDLRLPLVTPHDKLEQAVEIVRSALDGHEGMQEDFPPRIYLMETEEDAHLIRAIYWYAPPEYWDCLAMGERVQLQILAAFEGAGIRLAAPLRVAHTSAEGEEKSVEVRVRQSE